MAFGGLEQQRLLIIYRKYGIFIKQVVMTISRASIPVNLEAAAFLSLTSIANRVALSRSKFMGLSFFAS
ncbi:MAG: hypothetical protein ACI96W_003155 [Paraglaciecola sp.]